MKNMVLNVTYNTSLFISVEKLIEYFEFFPTNGKTLRLTRTEVDFLNWSVGNKNKNIVILYLTA